MGYPRRNRAFLSAILIGYAALSTLTLWMYAALGDVPFIYAAAGIYWMGLALSPKKDWLIIVPCVFMLQLTAEFVGYHSPPSLALAFSVSKTLEAVIGVTLIEWCCHWIARRGTVDRIQLMTLFLLIAVIAMPMLSAVMPALIRVKLFGSDPLNCWVQLALVQSVGVLIVAPLVYLLSQKSPAEMWRACRSQEVLALIGLTTILLWFVFFSDFVSHETAVYLVTPVLVWAAGRFGLSGAIVANFGLAMAAVLGNAASFFSAIDNFYEVTTTLDFYLLVNATVSLVLAAYADEHRNSLNMLINQRKRLQDLSVQLNNKEESFRREVATLLHDSIGQILALNKIRVDRMGTDPSLVSSIRLAEVSGGLADIIESVRALTNGVAQSYYQGQGLTAAIRDQAEIIFGESTVDLEFTGEQSPDVDQLTASIAFRASREIMFNVIKHSDATRVRVRVTCVSGNLRIRIADNGCGFDASRIDDFTHEDSFGLANTRNTIAAIGGSMQVTSSQRGTSVHILIPDSFEVNSPRDASTASILKIQPKLT